MQTIFQINNNDTLNTFR